mmetsp:Transcript_131243/g.293627  ORF Transcript_131243/g.293627 Transcript_131243/m.293627 type:complete len:216 (+) Transcript_131243:798-1445(+)
MIPSSGVLLFYIERDQDEDQAIYPAAMPDAVAKGTSIPVFGPDGYRLERAFAMKDAPGTQCVTSLKIDGTGKIVVSCQLAHKWKRTTWESAPQDYYSLVGSWSASGGQTSWECESMEAAAAVPGVFRGTFRLGMSGVEQFFIVVNRDFNKAMYPKSSNETPGAGGVYGPAPIEEDAELQWAVFGQPNQEMEVILDLLARDRRAMVTCQPTQRSLT